MRVALTELSRRLADLTGQPPVGYDRYYFMIVDGKLPAERDPLSGRYTVDIADAAKALGLTIRTVPAARESVMDREAADVHAADDAVELTAELAAA